MSIATSNVGTFWDETDTAEELVPLPRIHSRQSGVS